MSLIERAAQRLEELRKAGVEIPTANDVAAAPKLAPHISGKELSAGVSPQPQSSEPPPSLEGKLRSTTASNRARNYFELDLRKLAELGFVTPDMPRSRIADEFRVLKRPLIANTAKKRATPLSHGNLIMVTSAVPGEGKTFSAVNLAMSLAMELDRTVLLIDADVARPSLSKLFGLPPAKGLLDLLDDDAIDLGQVLVRTNIDKLSILPSGSAHAHATELLASDGMAQLLDEISARYADRIIIFDSPPLLITTEARVLAAQMGQIVFVVRAETTPQSDVKRALATIEPCPVKMMVLNQVQTTAQGAHGYGYGYGYGS